MASRPNFSQPEKPLAQLLSEFKDELKEFATTRIAMLQGEMRENSSSPPWLFRPSSPEPFSP